MLKPILFIALLFVAQNLFSQSGTSGYSFSEAVVIFSDTADSQDIDLFLNGTGMEILEGPTPILNCYRLRFIDQNLPYASGNPQDTINGVIEKAAANTKVDGAGLNFNLENGHNATPSSTNTNCDAIFTTLESGQYEVSTSIFDTGITSVNSAWGNFFVHTELGFDFIYNNKPFDKNNHGTHISSIIMEDLDNKNGGIQLSAYKTQNDNGVGTLFDAIQGIDKAIEEEVNVVNMSFSFTENSKHGDKPKAVFSVAMAKAESLGGILFVSSAGNHANDNDGGGNISWLATFPASYTNPNLITVASANCQKEISDFSNFGVKSVDVLAPGEYIWGLDQYGNDLNLSGTSQATAYVTKLATFLGTYQSSFDWQEVKCAILNGVNLNTSQNVVLTDGFVDPTESLSILLSNACGVFDYVEQNGNNESVIFSNIANNGEYEITATKNQICQIRFIDVMGRIFGMEELSLLKGTHTYQFENLKTEVQGIYFINVQGRELNKTFKVFK